MLCWPLARKYALQANERWLEKCSCLHMSVCAYVRVLLELTALCLIGYCLLLSALVT